MSEYKDYNAKIEFDSEELVLRGKIEERKMGQWYLEQRKNLEN